jgi:aspartyl-tRNA(Asn)/glutamyl-tRNA(Gln) amidotransferase subunit B
MRSKEGAHDYRYFPEPDLPPLRIDEAWVARVRESLPELPEARMARLVAAHGLSDYDADVLVRLIPGAADFFEATVAAGANAKTASNWIQGELRRKLKDIGEEDLSKVPFGPAGLAELTVLVDNKTISSSVAKEVFEAMWSSGQTARAIVDAQGLAQIGDTAALEQIVDAVIASHPDAVTQFRAGKTQTFGFLVGQVMKASKGKANPGVAGEILKARIG